MTMIEGLLQELEMEAATTRRVLERVPDAHLTWKPHAKSMSLGQLALHVAVIPGTIAEMSTRSPFQAPNFTQAEAASASELIPTLTQSVADARAILGGMTDADLGEIWRLVDGDRELMAMPRGALLRTVMLNHWYHHRGQLAVYLRQVGALVPSIYGPSADESPFATAASGV
jgi:uncharacterized damage-inducible protein DinB